MTDTRAWLAETLDAGRIGAMQHSTCAMLDAAADEGRLLIIGSAALPMRIMRAVRAGGGRVAAMVEYAPRFWGREAEGVPVLPLDEALALIGPDPVVLVGIWSPQHVHGRTVAWLATRGITRILPVMAAFWRWGAALGEHYQLSGPEPLLAAAPRIMAVHDRLADAQSRRHYAADLAWRLAFDHASLPEPRPEAIYFDRALLRLPDDAVVVDGGAFSGDALEHFLRWHGPRFGRYHAFEPDPISFANLTRYRDRLPPSVAARIALHQAGIGAAAGELRLNPSGTPGTITGGSGSVVVPCVRLDAMLGEERVDCIKLDTEGQEHPVLDGAAGIIARDQPALAISIYHKPCDIVTLPERAIAALPDAALHVRSHDHDGIDLVLTAVPRRFQP
jgi:FkbM family methyltransferase